MIHKSEPALEISPNHWIEVPAFAKSTAPVPSEIAKANHEAARSINAHKDTFIKLCLETLFTQEQIGELELKHLADPGKVAEALVAKLDPSKITLTIRNVYGPTIVIPSHLNPEQAKQEGIVRQTGHCLNMEYDTHWLGTMDIEYKFDGTIGIKMATKQ